MPPGVRGGNSATSSRLSPQRPSIGQYSSFLRLRHPISHFLLYFSLLFFGLFFGIWVPVSPLSRGRHPASSLPHGWLTVYVCHLLISSSRLGLLAVAPTVRRERHVNSRHSRLTRQPNPCSSELVNVDHITLDGEFVGRRLLHCLIVLSVSPRAQAYFLYEYSTCSCCE